LIDGDRGSQIDRGAAASIEVGVRRHFPSRVLNAAKIGQLRPGETQRWRDVDRYDRVGDLFVVMRHFESQPIAEQSNIESKLQLSRDLRFEIGISQVVGRQANHAPFANAWTIRLKRSVRVGLLARLAPRGTKLCRGDVRNLEERLLADDPRAADLWIDDELEILAECTVVVPAHGSGEVQASVP